MEKKYELTDETKRYDGRTFHRIRALKDFGNVKKDDLGGWIESEINLSQEGNCWVADNAMLSGNAKVSDEAELYGEAEVSGNAIVYGKAKVHGEAKVFGDAKIWGEAKVSGDARVLGHTMVYDNVLVNEYAHVFDDAKVSGNVEIDGISEIGGDAIIKDKHDYQVFHNNWSSGRYFTYTKSNHMWKVGCFYGTGEELIKKAYKDSEDKGKHYEAYVNLVKQLENLE